MDILCPCGSHKPLKQCCLVYISGQAMALTPQALMRSRYTAYVLQDADYLWRTWHPDKRRLITIDDLQQAFTDTQWLGLKLIACNEQDATVEFVATYREISSQRLFHMHERSRFIQLADQWFYIDGIKPDIKRNDPCPCGSGKKYKKCCSAFC